MSYLTQHNSCHVCNGKVEKVCDYGLLPPINAFSNTTVKSEYPAVLVWCPACMLVQLSTAISPEVSFKNYTFLTSASENSKEYMHQLAAHLQSRLFINQYSKILEIGSNDGTLLENFDSHSLRVGVDPAENLTEIVKAKGIVPVSEFFNEKVSDNIKKTYGKFDLIMALNVVAHTPDVLSLLRGVRNILSSDGTAVIEVPYIRETIIKGLFDTVYHEHLYHFSFLSLQQLLEQCGLEVYQVEQVDVQGGSLRLFARCKNDKQIDVSVIELEQTELVKHFDSFVPYWMLQNQFYVYKANIQKLIKTIAKDKKIIGIGAPARGMVLLNTCGLQNYIHKIVDDTPLKHHKLAPGTNVEVITWDEIPQEKDLCFLLLSWNYKDHLINKLKERFAGCEVVVPFPKLAVEKI